MESVNEDKDLALEEESCFLIDAGCKKDEVPTLFEGNPIGLFLVMEGTKAVPLNAEVDIKMANRATRLQWIIIFGSRFWNWFSRSNTLDWIGS